MVSSANETPRDVLELAKQYTANYDYLLFYAFFLDRQAQAAVRNGGYIYIYS